jgi:hypothetical protein
LLGDGGGVRAVEIDDLLPAAHEPGVLLHLRHVLGLLGRVGLANRAEELLVALLEGRDRFLHLPLVLLAERLVGERHAPAVGLAGRLNDFRDVARRAADAEDVDPVLRRQLLVDGGPEGGLLLQLAHHLVEVVAPGRKRHLRALGDLLPDVLDRLVKDALEDIGVLLADPLVACVVGGRLSGCVSWTGPTAGIDHVPWIGRIRVLRHARLDVGVQGV